MTNIAKLIGEGYPLREKKELPPYKIYCDMDGVLTDFEKRFDQFTGMNPQEYESKFGTEQFWHLIDNKIGVRFWVGMDWMPQGQRLWDFIKPGEASGFVRLVALRSGLVSIFVFSAIY